MEYEISGPVGIGFNVELNPQAENYEQYNISEP
jgi:hypothetical protein